MRRPAPRPLAFVTVALIAFGARALAQRAGDGSSPVVQMLRGSPDARVRAQAALTLARIAAPEAGPALRDALADRSPMVRAAAASTLASLRQADAIPALRARANDADANVRDAVSHALARLEGSTDHAAAGDADDAPPVDLTHVRFLVRPGEMTDPDHSGSARPTMLRDAIRSALRNRDGVALNTGSLPPAVQRRVRSGAVRLFSLDGGVQSVRRVPAAGGERMRAEVNLVIVSEAHHNIVGMVTGAASAPAPAEGDEASRRVEAMLIDSAVQAALRDIESALGTAM